MSIPFRMYLYNSLRDYLENCTIPGVCMPAGDTGFRPYSRPEKSEKSQSTLFSPLKVFFIHFIYWMLFWLLYGWFLAIKHKTNTCVKCPMFRTYLTWPATVNIIEEIQLANFTQRTLCTTNIWMFFHSFIFAMEDCVFSGNLLQIKVCEWVQEQRRIRVIFVVV